MQEFLRPKSSPWITSQPGCDTMVSGAGLRELQRDHDERGVALGNAQKRIEYLQGENIRLVKQHNERQCRLLSSSRP